MGGGVNWDIEISVCSLPCVNQIASGNLLCRAEISAWCSVVTSIVGMRNGVGGRSKREEI